MTEDNTVSEVKLVREANPREVLPSEEPPPPPAQEESTPCEGYCPRMGRHSGRRPPHGQGRQHRMGPPAEAVVACEGKTTGETCSFELEGAALDGVCSSRRNGEGPLACRPVHDGQGPGPRHHRAHRKGPPAEAVAACEGKSEGEACAFERYGRTIQSTCGIRPSGEGPLACRPVFGGKGSGGHGNRRQKMH